MSDAVERDKLFIGGDWVAAKDGQRVDVTNPGTGEVFASVVAGGAADIDAAVQAARSAQPAWAALSPEERATALEKFADAIDKRAADIARAVSSQNGMTISLASGFEAVVPSALCRYYAHLARTTPTSSVRDGLLGGKLEIQRQPYGVAAAIVPWNFPQTLAVMKVAPALAAGCTIVVKPDVQTALDSTFLEEAANEAGIPAGVINIVPGGAAAGSALVAHPGVDKVSFTGSTEVGRQVGATCGELLRPVTLELGGKSAAIILDDTDLAASAEGLFGATLFNNGQTCFLSSRVLAPKGRYDEVVEFLGNLASGAVVGDQLDPGTEVGPMISEKQRERVEGYIKLGQEEGSTLVAGGGRPDGPGFFVQPTIFANVDNSQRLAREEVFGPVISVIEYDGEDQAVAIANDSDYGLGGTVWSADPERAAAVARRVHTGTIGVNGYPCDPGGPFGGVKGSGLGREFATEGLDNYAEPKTIYLGA